MIVERPTYYGVVNALRSAGARILEVPLESDGMDIDKLEAHLSRHRPRLIYTNPTFQNPTGVTTSNIAYANSAHSEKRGQGMIS